MPTPLANDVALSGGGPREAELISMLEAERTATKDAKTALAEAEIAQQNMKKKFDQLKSAGGAQMAFMRKKLEENYQDKLDELEVELDEAHDEAAALRLQLKMMVEHIESGSPGGVPEWLGKDGIPDVAGSESRHVSPAVWDLETMHD